MTLGDRIADLRKERGLTQEALGEQLGVSRQAVSKWESDTATPDIEKLIGLSKAFDVTIGFLLGVEETTCEAQAAESASGEKRSEAEVLEHYLNELPKPRTL